MGFPTLKKLTDVYQGNDAVVFLAVQTVFEGHRVNTEAKLRENQLKYRLNIPMAHAAGDPKGRRVPKIMDHYRSGGTPWAVILDRSGRVAFNGFHIEVPAAVSLMNRLLEE